MRNDISKFVQINMKHLLYGLYVQQTMQLML